MVITLLGLVLLVGLILFVLNIGVQVNRRVSVQDQADATAIAAATWTARTMNMVAMNNTNMARTIALINILDALPQSAWNVEDETRAFLESLEAQLARGIGGGPTSLENEVKRQLELLRDDLQRTLEEIEPVAELFTNYDVRDLTYYNRNGALWRQLYALDEMNQTLMENLALVVQRNSYEAGEENLPDLRQIDGGLMILPLAPALPYQRGSFNDFQEPVVHGTLPPAIDDMQTNRGPWDTVYGWRTTESQTSGGEWVAGDIDGAGGGQGRGPGASGNGGNQGRRVGGQTVVNGYSTYGPRGYYLREVEDFNEDHLPNTRLYMWVREISEIKLNRLWPGITDHYPHYHNTEWEPSYETAKAIGERYHATRRLPRVLQTAYFMVEIKSKYPIGHARFMSEGTWAPTGDTPRIQYFGPQNGPNHGTGNRQTGGYAGWYDFDQPRWGVTRVNAYVWRNEWDYVVNWDYSIDIDPIYDANGDPEPQTVYRYDYYAFAGANTDWDKQPENPWSGFNPNDENAPAPMNLDHNQVAFDKTHARWRTMSFLAMARNSDVPQAWPTGFRGGRPSPNVVAIAQARVFNNHSFDMWTPMWHAKLEPVSDSNGNAALDDWLTVFSEGETIEGVGSEEVDTFFNYLQAITQLAPESLAH